MDLYDVGHYSIAEPKKEFLKAWDDERVKTFKVYVSFWFTVL